MSGFAKLKLVKLDFIIAAGEAGLSLPRYKGSTFRGGFGSTFKEIVCSQRQAQCAECLLFLSCPYKYIFETIPPANIQVPSGFSDAPRPFILRPPLAEKTDFALWENLTFSLILAGRGIDYLPYFILVFKELGVKGLGKGRRPFSLVKVESTDLHDGIPSLVYDASTGRIQNNLSIITGEQILEIPRPATHSLSLDFLTMTRLTSDERQMAKPYFNLVMRAVFRRLTSMLLFHHDTILELPFPDLLEQASHVELVVDATEWADWERYSSRQDAKMSMGGIVGKATYRGDLTPFYPYLKAAEFLHVGKGVVFGLGWVRMEA
ncbi:MAG: hypothetical protein FD169_1863 [Bacillota bacterium]|nr:MAG: hypothetical protein FD169_1863 [Bacillota bacterium]